MASPSYTPVPDIVFDDLLARLSGAELKVLLYIIRRTHGFGRSTDRISLSQLEDGIAGSSGRVLDRGTGLCRRSILDALRELERRGLVERRVKGGESDHGQASEVILLLTLVARAQSTAPADAPPEVEALPEAEEPMAGNNSPPEAIHRCLADFSREFHDEQQTAANITRATRLLSRSGLNVSQFCQLLYEARSISKQQNNIRKRARSGPSGACNRMPYFFAVLENLIAEGGDSGARSIN